MPVEEVPFAKVRASRSLRWLLALAVALPIVALLPAQANTSARKVPRVRDLPAQARRAWWKIERRWMRTTFKPCLRQAKVRYSCSECSSGVRIDVELRVDASGKLIKHAVVGQHVCGRRPPKTLGRCFLRPLERHLFAPPLRQRAFTVTLGTKLRC